MSALGCDFKRWTQHLNSHYREGGVVYEVPNEKILQRARQKLVYLELGLENELSRVIANDSILAKGAYQRSWEIVNEVGHEVFVAELR